MMTLKFLKSGGSAHKYYSHGDYYNQEGNGVWYGKGVEELGFKGGVYC
jgi:hypothetical protein